MYINEKRSLVLLILALTFIKLKFELKLLTIILQIKSLKSKWFTYQKLTDSTIIHLFITSSYLDS